MESAGTLDHVDPGAESEVVRVAEKDVDAAGGNLVRMQSLHGCVRTNRHERR